MRRNEIDLDWIFGGDIGGMITRGAAEQQHRLEQKLSKPPSYQESLSHNQEVL